MAETAPARAAPALLSDKNGFIATVTIDNQARLNAMTAAMWEALPAILRRLGEDDTVRVIVLRGAGTRAFSAGADISEFDTARSGGAAADYDALNHAAFNALTRCEKPTIAMIHGICFGGGLGLAMACDLRLAADTSSFSIPAVRLGLGYNARWVRRCSPPFRQLAPRSC